MCERHGGIKGVDTRTRKELKTTPSFSFSVTRKPNVLPLPALEVSGEILVGERDERWVRGRRGRWKIIQLWHVKSRILEGILVEMSSTYFPF